MRASRSSWPRRTGARWRSHASSARARVAFPAISCGIYGYPPELAAPVAIAAVRELEADFDLVRFVFRDDRLRDTFARAAEG